MWAWRQLHHVRDFFMGAFDNGIGPPPILGFSITHFGRRKLESLLGIKTANEESWSYTFGSYLPDAVAVMD
jgi:hypothetical protein